MNWSSIEEALIDLESLGLEFSIHTGAGYFSLSAEDVITWFEDPQLYAAKLHDISKAVIET